MTKGEIFFIRLKCGDDIISETWTTNNGKVYVLNKPMKLYYSYEYDTSYKGFGLQLSPWVFPSISPTQNFEIPWSEIVTVSKPSILISKLYLEAITFYLIPTKKETTEIPIEEPFEPTRHEDSLDNLDEESLKALQDFVSEQLDGLRKNNKK